MVVIITSVPPIDPADIRRKAVTDAFKHFDLKTRWFQGNYRACLGSIPHISKMTFLETCLKLRVTPFLLLKWLERYRAWTKCSLKPALSYAKEVVTVADVFLKSADPKVFFCWNRGCCAFGFLADILERNGVKVGTIELGYLPDTLTLSFRYQPFAGWLDERKQDNLDIETIVNLFSVDKLDPRGLYPTNRNSETFPEAMEYSKKRDTYPNLLFLGQGEPDAFIIPNWHSDRKRLLPFSKNCLDLFRQISHANREGVTIFKPHPNHNVHSETRDSENSWICLGDPRPFLEWADVVITSGTKLELDAYLLGKIIFNIGSGVLWGTGMSREFIRKKDLSRAIEDLEKGTAPKLDNPSASLARKLGADLIIPTVPEHNLKVVGKIINNITQSSVSTSRGFYF